MDDLKCFVKMCDKYCKRWLNIKGIYYYELIVDVCEIDIKCVSGVSNDGL